MQVLGNILELAFSGFPQKALEQLEKVHTRDQPILEAQLNLAKANFFIMANQRQQALPLLEKAVLHHPNQLVAQFRLAETLMELKNYQKALPILQTLILFKNHEHLDQIKTWMKHCQAQIEQKPMPTPESEIEIDSLANKTPTGTEKSSTTSKFRQEFYQTTNVVTLDIFAKNCSSDNVEITFKPSSLHIEIDLEDTSWIQDYILWDDINAPACTFEILKTKIEIRMPKFHANKEWDQLVQNENSPRLNIDAEELARDIEARRAISGSTSRLSYPSSAKRTTDWNALAASIDEEEVEGQQALNKLFQDIYGKGNEETQRAMMKSFTESNGQVLSTDWNEVGKKKVEYIPPSEKSDSKGIPGKPIIKT